MLENSSAVLAVGIILTNRKVAPLVRNGGYFRLSFRAQREIYSLHFVEEM
jgi:hypothetical protein